MDDKKGEPLDGWLIVFAVGLVGGLIFDILVLFSIIKDLFSFNYDNILETNSKSDALRIYFETYYSLTIVIIFTLISILLNYLFFTKNKEFPKAYIYLSITNIVLLMSAEFTQILRGETVYFQLTIVSAVAFIICGLYLLKSKRVKETFVQTLRKKYVKLTIEEYELLKKNIFK